GDGLAVEQDRARAAHADPACLADAEQAELAADDVEDRLVGARLELMLGAVDPHAQLHTRTFVASSTVSGFSGSSSTSIPSDATALPTAGGTGGSAVSPSPCTSAPSSSISS